MAAIIQAKVANAVVVITTIVWAVSFMTNIVNSNYHPPAGIQSSFLAVIGAAFGMGLRNGGS